MAQLSSKPTSRAGLAQNKLDKNSAVQLLQLFAQATQGIVTKQTLSSIFPSVVWIRFSRKYKKQIIACQLTD